MRARFGHQFLTPIALGYYLNTNKALAPFELGVQI